MDTLDQNRRAYFSILLRAGCGMLGGGRALLAANSETPYLQVVRRCADALLEHGRDNLGPRKTAMILSMLDRKTLRPPAELPDAPMGIRPGDRTNVYGSNANLQQNLFLAFQHLSRITGKPQYAEAADQALLDLIRVTQHPATGLLAWGEHLFWDCKLDQAGTMQRGNLIHEPKRKLMFFDRLYEAEPQRTLAFARGVWEHQIANHETGDFSRHARYDAHGPSTGADFLKEAGYFIDLWSRAYHKTRDPLYLRAITVLTNRYLGRMNERNLLDFDSSPAPDRDNNCLTNDMLALAVEAQPAAARVDEPTRLHLMHLVDRLDDGFLRLPHAPDDAARGFHYSIYTDTGKLRPRKEDDGHSRHWALGYGVKSTSLFGVLCHTRYRQLKNGPRANLYRNLFLRAADLYRKVHPKPEVQDIWAGEFGMAVFLEIAASRATGDAAYLETARTLADKAIQVYWDDGSLLPRASSKTGHYEAITYSDTLLLSLLAVDEHVGGRKPVIEISDVDR